MHAQRTVTVLFPPVRIAEDRVRGERAPLAGREHEGELRVRRLCFATRAIELVEELGDRELDAAVRRAHAREALFPLVDREDDRALTASIASKSASAASGGEPMKPARASEAAIWRRRLADRPNACALGETLREEIADRAIEQDAALSRPAAGSAMSSKNFARNAMRLSSQASRSASIASLGSAPSASASRACNSASEKSPGSGGISALRR